MKRIPFLSIIVASLLFFFLPVLSSSAQTRTENGKTIIAETVELDKMIHDFGDVMMSEKLLHCSFKVKNVSAKPIVIFNVTSSCGCTNVRWTREPLTPGKTGEINVDYTNDAGPYPFDKTLTVYVSGMKKPVILRLRGVVHQKKKPLGEMFPVRMGNLGLKEVDIKLGNLKQGDSKGDSFQVANLGKSPMQLTFSNVSEGLELKVSPNPIPANQIATIEYTVTSDEDTWGKNYYWFTPLVGGRPAGTITHSDASWNGGSKIGVWTFTVKDFSDWSKEEIRHASQPMFQSSSFTFPKTKKGEQVTARYTFTNKGKSDAVLYKIDCDWKDSEVEYEQSVAPGKTSEIVLHLDTTKMPEGDVMWTVLLTTNCPLRPYITLYIYGNID